MTYKTNHTTIAKATVLAIATALLALALAPSALAGPTHKPLPTGGIEGLDKACGAAVDSKGDVYASSAGEDKIKVFGPAPDHDLLTTIENPNEPCALAVDTKGRLFVSEQGTGNVVMYVPDKYPFEGTPTYGPAATIDESGDAKGIAIDRADDSRLYVAKGDHVDVYRRSETQQLSVSGAVGGTYKLRFEGQETAPLAYNATAAQIQAALEALSTIGTGNVTVNGGTISFVGELAFTDVPQVEVLSSLTGNETQQVKVTATAGTFRLLFAGEQTAPLAFNASAAELEAALEALTAISPADVSVAGGPGGPGGTTPYGVTFAGAYANSDVPQLLGDISALTGTVSVTPISQVQTVTVNATAGSYKLKFEGEETTPIAFNASAGAVQTALEELAKIAPGDVTVSGGPGGTTPYLVDFKGAFGGKSVDQMFHDATGLTGTVSVVATTSGPSANVSTSASGGLGVDEAQQISTEASGGSYKLKFEGEETTPIAFNSSSAEVQAALEALGNIAPGDVSVSRIGNLYTVNFEGAYAATNVPQITVASSLSPNEVQKLTVSATAGSYKLKFEGEETAAVLFSASAAEVQAALEAIAKIAPGNVTVSGGPGGPGGTTPYLVSFEGTFAGKNVKQMTSAKVGLVGSATVATPLEGASASASTTTGGSGAAIEDPLADYTGVAAYTYTNAASPSNARLYLAAADEASDQVEVFNGPTSATSLKLRKTISGVDHDENPSTPDQAFGFGTAGAYLAADPGNESAEHKCTGVAEQACTAGHFFFYDAVNEVVDEFDATGEFVSQIKTPVFEDSEPTALAVDRSATVSDGTLYVGAGSSVGAKLLAFGPLVMPSRSPAPALSRALTGAAAVATDCIGNVYVSAESLIRIYTPAGSELTNIIEPNKLRDLSIDCAGNVYVVDVTTKELFTYYSPSKYPPDNTTTYTRHEPPLIPSAALVGEGPRAVAVNPANDHVFVLGKIGIPAAVFEFGSVAEESPLKNECAADLLGSGNNGIDIDVYGATGEVYVSANPTVVSSVMCGAESGPLIRQMRGGGCPNGEFGANPAIAVDQSNGHIVEFANNQPGAAAREYDGAGACVAEFGTFSGTSGSYHVAIDSSCALHDPPLTEETTPTCAQEFPSNDTVYVASDGNDNGVQPFDVNAFGPLNYGEEPNADTGLADGFGPTTATLNGTVDPRGFLLEDCHFEYLTEEKYEENGKAFAGAETASCAESPAEVGKGLKAVPVHADISGLETEEKRYRFRLLVTNAYGESDGGTGLFGPPQLQTETALPIGYDEATMRAQVDPSGLATEYHFEYGTEEGVYGQSTPTAEIAPGDGYVALEVPVTGLDEGTEYHFRLVAVNGTKTIEGPDQTLETLERAQPQACANAEYRTGFGAFLPDCRAYELVTPAATKSPPGAISHGSGQKFFNSWFVAPRGSGAGESIAYAAGIDRVDGVTHRAQRGAGDHPEGGWTSEITGFSFAQSAQSQSPHGLSSDQRYWLFDVLGVDTPTELSFPVANYMRVPAGQANRDCSPEPKAQFELSDSEAKFELVGCGSLGTDLTAEGRFISAGGTHVIFTSDEELEDDSPATGSAIYDREASEASAELVSVKPDGTPFEGVEAPIYIGSTEDGTAVVFKAGNALYLRRGGETTEVAAAPNTYGGISEDGQRVFFVDNTSSPAGLFACDVEGGHCAGPEQDQGPIAIATNSVFVNVSADGSHVFFTSEDALTGAEANENGEEAQASESNLYAWDGTAVSFVAILHPQDLVSFRRGPIEEEEESQEDLLQWTSAIPGQKGSGSGIGRAYSPTRSTPDGEALVFQSHAQLTGYDNDEKGEIYRYAPDAAPGTRLACVSCDPSGAPHDSVADARLQTVLKITRPDTLIPNLTDDGQTVVFESREALLPEDANLVTDVYQWKAQGTEGPGGDTCERPGGCLALISTGQGEEDSYLYGMSADAKDVFFETREELTGADISGTFSIYDARVLGGIPNPPLPAPCEGDACQGQGSTPPNLPAAATTGAGNGNEQAQPNKSCAKGKRRVKGRCVKKKHAKKNQKHAKKHRADHDRRAHR